MAFICMLRKGRSLGNKRGKSSSRRQIKEVGTGRRLSVNRRGSTQGAESSQWLNVTQTFSPDTNFIYLIIVTVHVKTLTAGVKCSVPLLSHGKYFIFEKSHAAPPCKNKELSNEM